MPVPGAENPAACLNDDDPMTLLHALRRLTRLHRLVLAGWLLALGAAFASPIVHPQAVELVCSAGGAVKMVAQADGDAVETRTTGMDCPLCSAPCMPAARAPQQTSQPLPLGRALQSIPAARLAAATAAPPPARGPPARC